MRRTPFDDGWTFSRNDGEYEPVVVPHDAMLGNERREDAPAGSASGYYTGARYRYRKSFELSESQANGVLKLEFEGVYRDARIAVNGNALEAPPYGFVPFLIDISPAVRPGANVIEVEADNESQPDCRWYSGGGLYRPVWLWEGGPLHIEPEGIRVTTLSYDPATVRVQVRATGGTPSVSIVDPGGAVVACGEGRDCTLSIPRAQLWSEERPDLYRCRVTLTADGTADVTDQAETSFGIRMVEWNEGGLFVNGRETLLRGGCIHCDNGVLGAASWPASERRRIRLLKQAGFNAVRVAHNPAPAALLEACDEMGVYVMDEAWDMWFMRKNPHDYAQHFLGWCDHDLRRLVSHDYNHPSVIMYSIGNEIADPLAPGGVELERSLVDLVHALDSTRPVTCGFNLTMMVMERIGRRWYAQNDGDAQASLVNGDDEPPRGSLLFNLAAQATGTGMTLLANAPGADALVSPALDALDIAGYNYAAARYRVDARKHPSRIVVGTETFPYDLPRNWKLVEELPNLVGDFMWAGWDYLGEAGAGAWAYTAEEAGFSKPWPWLVAGSGALDILGNPNAHAALAGAVWKTASAPSIAARPVNVMDGKTYRATWRGSDAIPSWSWRGCEGVTTEVEVYAHDARSVRLELDGRIVGTRPVKRFVSRFEVEYRPGTLTAIALDETGREVSRSSLASAQGPLRLEAAPETPTAKAGDVAYVAIAIVGANGVVESNADERVEIEVLDGELVGFGSARPATTESFLAGSYTTYRGRAIAVVHRSGPGNATLVATGPTLGTASVLIPFA